MEMNKDEATRCLGIAQRRRDEGDLAGALRFARKSVSLFPTAEAESLMNSLAQETENGSAEPSATSSASETAPGPELRQRHTGGSSSAKTTSERRPEPSSHSSSYTEENMRAVKRVLACSKTDFYEILSIEKSATDIHVKKAYRKLALQLHPDKNSAPGADEAFKLVSKAFTVLSDEDKRAQFDRYGADPESRSASAAAGNFYQGGGAAFETEITPEQLFNMFFGGDLGGGRFDGGDAFRFGGQPRQFTQRHHQQRAQREEVGGNGLGYLVQLLPLLLLLIFTMTTTLFSGPSEPSYSFSPTYNHHNLQHTEAHQVAYYVNPRDLNAYVSGSRHRMQRFEQTVEADYVRHVQTRCRQERDMRRHEIRRARGWFGLGADEAALQRAENKPTPACDELNRFMG
ncbi:hypothetical protein THASP1DRAFT_15926 [Thamnocephalis sphaerospora]|uniref:J domain-containing protein n=1 Tax=Thamnocephalis sphaerospora TaxID=78915 RepID=A0A4P9XSA7_9FUNG|nr:hypothetical protein THASP1DRAFT_15926 [Thamnocephalis sphaerospora]|eukprot:RKP08230.1 hypothetical protein THASP1DRAFT_15926 [Thamnocephalis sphaerospora]